MSPRTGPCAPWINGSVLKAVPKIKAQIEKVAAGKVNGLQLSEQEIDAICAEGAAAATDILYRRSGRIFTGECGPVTIRPVARPVEVDVRTWLGGAGAWGYSASWGSCSYYGLGAGGVVSHFGCSSPPEIELGVYPVNEIVQVLIDGVVIPPNEYTLRDFRTLVRMRPTPSFVPTERFGWPTCQINDLPDTEPGTFSITYKYGQDPGAGGRLAAKALAEILVLPQFGDATHYPARVTSVQRQGVSAMAVDVLDILNKGMLGVYEVDSWLLSVNPQKAQRQSVVWSPDLGKPRRTATPSVPPPS